MRNILKSCRRFAFAVSCLALAALSATIAPVVLGQSATTGAITGTVKDTSGAVIPNATVTVTSLATGQARTATTGSSGAYTVGFLPPDNYSVKFEAAGFGTATVPSITINVTETPTLDQVLSIGAQSQQVEVHGEAAELVQTTSATNGTVIDSHAVTEIPLTTRNYTNLMGLSAGVQATVFNAITLGRGSQDIEVNGAGPSQNNYSQDGASINSYSGTSRVGDSGNNPGMAIVNPDAISEFKIQTSMYDASYGRNPGANVNVVTKSGSNQYHGTAFEFFRNTALNANDYFRKLNPPINGIAQNGRPVLNQNQFGGSFGGPIKKDKLFFFVSEQETRQINGAAAQGYSTPTLPAIPSGDRSTPAFQAALGAAFGPNPTCGTLLSNGNSNVGGVQIACNGSNINPVALKILNLKLANGSYFVPSSGLASGANATVAQSSPVHFTEHQVIGNFDYQINQKNTLGFRFFWAHDPAAITESCAGSGGGANSTGTITACLLGAPGLTNFPAMYDTLRLTTLVTNNLVNEARLSLQTIQAHPVQEIPFTNAQVGIANIIPAEPSLDTIIINNPKLQFGAGNNLANFDDTGAWEAADSISWSHGKHTVRAGFEYERDRVNMIALKLSLGTLTFQTFQDFLLGLPGCTSAQLAMGCSASNPMGTNGSQSSNLASTGTNGYGGPNGLTQNFRDNIADGFVQDDFKILSNLTLNMGVRWEYDGWPIEINGKNTNTWLGNLGGASNIPVGTTVNGVAGTLGSSAATGSLDGWVVASNYNPANYPAPPVAGVTQSPFPGVAQFPKDAFAPRFGVAWKPLSTNRLSVRGGFGIFYDRLGYSFVGRTSGNPPYSIILGNSGTAYPAASFSQPYLPGPYSLGWSTSQIRWGTINAAGNTGTSSVINTGGPVGPVLKVPTTNQYNLSLQYEFLSGWVLDLGYVGSYAYHLFPQANFTEHEFNQAILASPSNPVYGITLDSVSNANYRVPYLGFSPSGLYADETTSWSKYNSLQVTVKKQLSHGLSFSAAYSFARSISDAYYVGDYDDSTKRPYGLNGFYRPQRLAINYNYALPISKHDGFIGKAINGWSVSGVTVVQSGDPLTPVDARGGTAYGEPTSRVLSTAILLPGKTPKNEASTLGGNDVNRLGCANTTLTASGAGTCAGGGWFNRAAFDQVAFLSPVGTPTGDGVGIDPNHVAGNYPTLWGNSGYGTTLGPGQFNFDISIQKSTVVGGLHEDATLQFRTDFFNAFNHPQFIDPVVDLSQPAFGQITAASVNPRLMQFSLKYIF